MLVTLIAATAITLAILALRHAAASLSIAEQALAEAQQARHMAANPAITLAYTLGRPEVPAPMPKRLELPPLEDWTRN